MTLWTLACEISLQEAAEVDRCVHEIMKRLDVTWPEEQPEDLPAEG
jgi:hypothetical protein